MSVVFICFVRFFFSSLFLSVFSSFDMYVFPQVFLSFFLYSVVYFGLYFFR